MPGYYAGMNCTPLLDADDAARLLAVTIRRVKALVRRGEIPHVTLPTGEVRFEPGELSRWLESCRQPSGEASP